MPLPSSCIALDKCIHCLKIQMLSLKIFVTHDTQVLSTTFRLTPVAIFTGQLDELEPDPLTRLVGR